MDAILYSIALDSEGVLIKANNADKKGNFFCPICRGKLTLRKSGNVGKGAKRPHFSHRVLTTNCTPETVLHYAFKNLLSEKIQEYINELRPLPITWKCENCRREHSGNLLKKITSVKVEHNLKICQPDIALLTAENVILAVIEIVVTHKPEELVLKYYHDNNIMMIKINLQSDNDIDELENKIKRPDLIAFCFNPRCKRCGNYLKNRILYIIEGFCPKCKSPMKVAIKSGSQELEKLTLQEVEFIRSKGANLKLNYNRWWNACIVCKKIIKDFDLYTGFGIELLSKNQQVEDYDMGYYCDCHFNADFAQQK
jgi:Zn finger protein HypA/HybF involved in hydrogenase expression